MNNREKKGFTLAELLIVVSIIGVLVAVAIPTFTNQLEKSREATDFANVRSAYAELMVAAISEDVDSPFYRSDGTFAAEVSLKQTRDGWTTKMDGVVVGGVAYSDQVHWRRKPKAGGKCKISFSDEQVFLDWGGKEDHINQISAADFLTKDILSSLLGEDYSFSLIASNEPLHQGGGTNAFVEFAKKQGIDLAGDYDAKTWQIYVKDPTGGNIAGNDFLSNPAMYWSTVEVDKSMVGKYVPVIGYRDGKYDVYRAEVVTYNKNTVNEYSSIKYNFANITEAGGSASFQFDSYGQAKAAYDDLLKSYNTYKTVSNDDLSRNNL